MLKFAMYTVLLMFLAYCHVETSIFRYELRHPCICFYVFYLIIVLSTKKISIHILVPCEYITFFTFDSVTTLFLRHLRPYIFIRWYFESYFKATVIFTVNFLNLPKLELNIFSSFTTQLPFAAWSSFVPTLSFLNFS